MSEVKEENGVKTVEAHLNYENMYFTAINNKDNIHAIAALESNKMNCKFASDACLQTKFCPECKHGWKNGKWKRIPKEEEANASKSKSTKKKKSTTQKKGTK